MPIALQQIHPAFVGRITDVDLRRPLDPEAVRELSEAIDRHLVLLFPQQSIEDDHLAAFGRCSGPLYDSSSAFAYKKTVIRLTNLDQEDRMRPADDQTRALNAANELWHVDNSFSEPPAKYSVLMARTVPPDGGETEFADARAGYDALPDLMKKKVEGLIAEHSFIYSRSLTGVTEWTDEQRAALPTRRRRLIKTNENTGRKSLYITSHISQIVGLPPDESRSLLRELTDITTQPQFVYTHRWQPGDLIMYDNRAAMHRARPFASLTHPRDMRAIRVLDIPDPDRIPH